MRSTVLIALVAALAVTMVSSSEETISTQNVHTMTRTELMKELTAARTQLTDHKHKLDMANTKMRSLEEELDAITDEDEYEDSRKANEKSNKAKDKKKAAIKRKKQLKKKTKFSDVLMEHVAKFLAFEAAKKTASQGSIKQKAAILEAARTGARAGAVKPLKKVARDTAVAAVKKARAAAKKAGTKGKHALRKISVKAAKDAVNKLIQDQEELVEKAAQKFLKVAIKKHPPSVVLAEDDDKPNHFTAPPGIHLSLSGAATEIAEKDNEPKEVKPIKEEPEKEAPKKVATKKVAPKKVAPKKVAPKADAVVPETEKH
jgi:hypothetical protein